MLSPRPCQDGAMPVSRPWDHSGLWKRLDGASSADSDA